MTEHRTITTQADALRRTAAQDQEAFSRDARDVADLAEHIAASPAAQNLSGDLSRLSQQVTELVRRAARIKATVEALEMMQATSSVDVP